jgi:hypothetical protein
MANLAGALAIFAAVMATAAFLEANEIGYFLATVVAAAAILTGRHFWVDKQAPTAPTGWAYGLLLVLVGGSVVFSLEMAVGKMFNPNLGFVEAGFHTGPFGGICTVAVTAFIALVAIGGLFRSIALKWFQRSSP